MGAPKQVDLAAEFALSRKAVEAKMARLKEMDVFILDNSLRESTVAQLRGHTLENKTKIYEEVKKCGFKNCVVAAYGHNTRVDDVWVKQLIANGEDPDGLFAFSDITSGRSLNGDEAQLFWYFDLQTINPFIHTCYRFWKKI